MLVHVFLSRGSKAAFYVRTECIKTLAAGAIFARLSYKFTDGGTGYVGPLRPYMFRNQIKVYFITIFMKHMINSSSSFLY